MRSMTKEGLKCGQAKGVESFHDFKVILVRIAGSLYTALERDTADTAIGSKG